MSTANLKLVVPYGRANAQNHFTYGVTEGDVTLCGRNCYGWSVVGPVEAVHLGSAFTCKRCGTAIFNQ